MTLVATLLVLTVAAAVRGTWSPCGLSMVSAINPLSERARGNRYWLTTVWFVAGAVLGGAGLGIGAALLAFLLRPLGTLPELVLATAGCLLALAADLRLAGFHLPLQPRQVNELWLMRYRRWLYATGFGVQIGVGFATYIMTAATYLVVLLAGLAGSPALALLAGLLFGLVRGSAVLLSSRCRSAGALQRLHARLSALESASLRTVMLLELLAAIALGAAAGGIGGVAAGGIGGAVLVAVLAVGMLLPRLPRRETSGTTDTRNIRTTASA